MQEPNDKPLTHEDRLFDNGRVYGNRGTMEKDCEAVRSEYWKPAGQIQESVTAKYLKATEIGFHAVVSMCAVGGYPLSNYQQLAISHALASVYQDGMIAALREQTDRAVKS